MRTKRAVLGNGERSACLGLTVSLFVRPSYPGIPVRVSLVHSCDLYRKFGMRATEAVPPFYETTV